VRKVWRQLRREGFDIAPCNDSRLMDQMGWKGAICGKTIRTTLQDKGGAMPLDHFEPGLSCPGAELRLLDRSCPSCCAKPLAYEPARRRTQLERNSCFQQTEGQRSMQNGFVESFNGWLRDECLNEHIFSSLVNRLAAAERAAMFSDDPPILADYDSIGLGMNFDRAPDGTGCDRVFVVVKAHQAGFGDRRRTNRPS
jgi:hypothetical protein